MTDASVPRKIDWMLLAIGAIFACGGIYFVLVGFGLVPGPGKIHGPLWLALPVGIAFFSAGINVMIRGWLGLPDKEANLPEGSPVALVALQWLTAVAALAGLASIGTWIAFGGGPRTFSTPVPLPASWAEVVGRTMFGFGTLLAWFAVLVFAHAGWKKIFGRNSRAAASSTGVPNAET